VSREGARSEKREETAPAAGTPLWIGALYFLGAVGAVLLGFLVLLKLAAAYVWDNAPSFDPSMPAIVVWGGLIALAIGTWIVRSRR
jgi:hypothetical protein